MFKKLRNKLLIINTLIIAALVLSSFSVIYIMTAQNVNKKHIAKNLTERLNLFVPTTIRGRKTICKKPIDDVPPNQNGNVPPNPNTADPNADNINKSDKQKAGIFAYIHCHNRYGRQC